MEMAVCVWKIVHSSELADCNSCLCMCYMISCISFQFVCLAQFVRDIKDGE